MWTACKACCLCLCECVFTDLQPINCSEGHISIVRDQQGFHSPFVCIHARYIGTCTSALGAVGHLLRLCNLNLRLVCSGVCPGRPMPCSSGGLSHVCEILQGCARRIALQGNSLAERRHACPVPGDAVIISACALQLFNLLR